MGAGGMTVGWWGWSVVMRWVVQGVTEGSVWCLNSVPSRGVLKRTKQGGLRLGYPAMSQTLGAGGHTNY